MTIHSQHRITVNAPQADVFRAITTQAGLKGWYTPTPEGEPVHGRKLKLHFKTKEGPFEWKVTERNPGSTLQWECIDGPGSAIGSTATFNLMAKDDNKTVVDLDYQGLELKNDKGRVCNTMWGALMHHLKKYVETKKADPAFH
jgi:uncharacterized protein YndB with AHSA1/START domain